MKDFVFIFDRYEYSDQSLSFYYAYQDSSGQIIKEFKEILKLDFALDADNPTISFILQQLHLVIGTSYYKSLLGEIKLPYSLNQGEADFWNTVYENGFGEFAYVNKLERAIRPFEASASKSPSPAALSVEGVILGIGGGKDSIVAGEILKKLEIPTGSFHLSTRAHQGQAGEVITLLGFPEIIIERHLDTSVVEFTDEHQGYHGHIPFSAILAWLGVLAAVATNRRYVCMANEAASSVGNVEWNKKIINHQWSKSYEFESLMQDFVQRFVSPDIWFFSPLRPYSSLAVVKLFARFGSAYHLQFTSCNLVLRIDPAARPNNRWCGSCAKCLSSWLLLAVYLSSQELETIFNKNLWNDEELRPMLKELLGLEGHKPLDCVGTTEELRAAARHILETDQKVPLLKGISSSEIEGPSLHELETAFGPHNIPDEFVEQLTKTIDQILK